MDSERALPVYVYSAFVHLQPTTYLLEQWNYRRSTQEFRRCLVRSPVNIMLA